VGLEPSVFQTHTDRFIHALSGTHCCGLHHRLDYRATGAPDSGCEQFGWLGIGGAELRQDRIRLGDTHRHLELTTTSVTDFNVVGI
jgi:hypothetical protein